MYNIVHVLIITIWTQIARGQLDLKFLAQDFQIQEGGSQDFLIQNVSGSTETCLQRPLKRRPKIVF